MCESYYTIVASIFFSIILILPQYIPYYTIVVSISAGLASAPRDKSPLLTRQNRESSTFRGTLRTPLLQVLQFCCFRLSLVLKSSILARLVEWHMSRCKHRTADHTGSESTNPCSDCSALTPSQGALQVLNCRVSV